MRRLLLTTTILGACALAGTGWVAAQTPVPHHAPAAKESPKEAHAHGGMGMMMGGGMCPMMGGGMGMGMGMMGTMGGADTQVAVKNIDKGVTITFTSSDPAKVVRLQKLAEAMRLMHEANTP